MEAQFWFQRSHQSFFEQLKYLLSFLASDKYTTEAEAHIDHLITKYTAFLWIFPACTRIHVRTCTHSLTHTHSHSCAHMHSHACTHMHTHAHMHTRTHARTHTYMHTHLTCACILCLAVHVLVASEGSNCCTHCNRHK